MDRITVRGTVEVRYSTVHEGPFLGALAHAYTGLAVALHGERGPVAVTPIDGDIFDVDGSNTRAIEFPRPVSDWGVVTHAVLMQNGEVLATIPLSSRQIVHSGDLPPAFQPGALTIRFS